VIAAQQAKLVLSDASAGRFAVAVVLHTRSSDWSRQELAGIVATLEHQATIFEIVDWRFNKNRQNRNCFALRTPRSTLLSVCQSARPAFWKGTALSQGGKKLVLLDNAPSGLRPGVDYLCVSSADHFGIEAIAA
jgi:ribose transport system substrate-binding protein